jgi:hypothetical protein
MALLAILGPGPAPALAQDVSVFAPGSVSRPDDNLYRGSFTADGTTFYFFRKVTEGREDYRIYRSTRHAGAWGSPVEVRLGAGGESNLYPAVSPDGRHLVFTSYRPFPGDTSATPNANLWHAELDAGDWGEPRPLTLLSVPGNYDAGPWFDRRGALHWVSVSPDWQTRWHRVAAGPDAESWQDDPLLAPWADWRDDVRLWGATPSPDGDLMVLDVSERPNGGRWEPSDLWLARRITDGWSEPRRLGPAINTPGDYENFVVFSPDGRDMLFVRGFTTYYRVALSQLEHSAAHD